MIWRILGYIGAASFLVTGFTVLSDPSCISADIGGGRVLMITCRADDYGAFPGKGVGFFSLIVGIGLLALLNWSRISIYFGNKSNTSFNSLAPTVARYNFKNSEIRNEKQTELTSFKTCSKCDKTVPMDVFWCRDCYGTSFNHSQVPTLMANGISPSKTPDNLEISRKKFCSNCKLEVAMEQAWCSSCTSSIFEYKEIILEPVQLKTCPMCAEKIQPAAKKCRYCQHMQDA